jgi:hypothetical protein
MPISTCSPEKGAARVRRALYTLVHSGDEPSPLEPWIWGLYRPPGEPERARFGSFIRRSLAALSPPSTPSSSALLSYPPPPRPPAELRYLLGTLILITVPAGVFIGLVAVRIAKWWAPAG